MIHLESILLSKNNTMVDLNALQIGEEYTDENGKIWLKKTDKVFVENTPISIEEALKDPESIKSLLNIANIVSEKPFLNQEFMQEFIKESFRDL